MRKINEIIIHCTDTPFGRDVSVEDIDLWHKEKGYYCIGYHYVIDLKGNIHPGRSVSKIGAHCKGHNAHSIGICYVGGRHKNGAFCDTLNYRQRCALIMLISRLFKEFPTIDKISGHNDYSNKACPCFDVSALNRDFQLLKGGVNNEY